MVKGFQASITIKDVIDKIDENNYVLPGIQRKFVWKIEQIELLFDSIMREYPLNSFMFWEIKDSDVKKNNNYYSFLRKYRQRFAVENELINKTASDNDFYAIIDGQQRLNSLYIGLKGSYSIKKGHKHWIDKSDNFDEKFLYLDISSKYQRESDIDKEYNFKFLTQDEANSSTTNCWYKVGDILELDSKYFIQEINEFVDKQKSAIEDIDIRHAQNTLYNLYRVIMTEKIINYYQEDEQQLDKILDIFIRTNNGGTKLTFSDLLMSVLTNKWKESRDEFDALIKDIRNFGDFDIGTDLIIKIILMLYSQNIKNRVKNFNEELLDKVENNWLRIKLTVSNTFEMFYRMGFNSQTFPSLNAAIPIIYFIYKNNLEKEVVKYSFSKTENYKRIKKWLLLVFLKRIFSGQTDATLIELRKIINDSGNEYPLHKIMNEAKSNPTRNYNFDSDFIDDLFERNYGENKDIFFVLSLYYPELDYYNQNFHIDHLHPQAMFKKNSELDSSFLEKVGSNWNKLGNLQLLNSELNTSKNDKSLKEWVEISKISRDKLFVNEDTNLEILEFENFYETRVQNMKRRLKELLN